MKRMLALALMVALAGCDEEGEEGEAKAPVRGLKTYLVADTERAEQRRFPSVLEPTALNTLSFDIAGRLTEVTLQVGQRVNAGDVLAQLDTEALEIQVRNAEAGLRSAEAALERALENLARQEELLESGTVTVVTRDDARTEATRQRASVEQAEEALASAQDNLTKATLSVPFDAILNSVDVQSFQTVAAATPIVTLYSPDAFEVAFTANFEVVSQLVVGTPAMVRLADQPNRTLSAVVSEIGARADSVASFPVVLTLTEGDDILKAGMAVEASIELPLPAAEGFSIPLSSIIQENAIDPESGRAQVFVYDADTSTVVRREVQIAGVRENALLIINGLEPGDRIASAGVSFLREGQEVKLLEGDN